VSERIRFRALANAPLAGIVLQPNEWYEAVESDELMDLCRAHLIELAPGQLFIRGPNRWGPATRNTTSGG